MPQPLRAQTLVPQPDRAQPEPKQTEPPQPLRPQPLAAQPLVTLPEIGFQRRTSPVGSVALTGLFPTYR